MKAITVENLSTNETMTFADIIASQAVINAWLLSNKRAGDVDNPKAYNDLYHQLTWGEKTVAMGDWCALRD